MQIIHWGILMVLVVVVPFLLGMIPVKYMNTLQRTPAMLYVCGWFVSFALFELVSVPFIILEQSFTFVVIVYTFVLVLFLILSVWKGKEALIGLKRQLFAFTELTVPAMLIWLLVLVMIGAQIAAAVFLEYYDGDDAYYIAEAVAANTFDTMYLNDNYTGYLYPLDVRHALSPTPIYQAWLSRLSGIHAAVIAHSVLSVVWLVLMYCIFAQLARRLFPQKKIYRPIFMLLITIWYTFGNISIYTTETFAITRTWQGKGLMAGAVLPALFLCLMYLADKRPSGGIWMLFTAVVISAVFATSIAFMLIPTLVGVAAVMIAWHKRSFKAFVQIGVCCVPCLMLAVCYLVAG